MGGTTSIDGCLTQMLAEALVRTRFAEAYSSVIYFTPLRPLKEPFLPIVKVVLFIFTVAAVSVVLYIFFLRHRCCLILIRHLQPGSEEPPRAGDGFKPPSLLLAQSGD